MKRTRKRLSQVIWPDQFTDNWDVSHWYAWDRLLKAIEPVRLDADLPDFAILWLRALRLTSGPRIRQAVAAGDFPLLDSMALKLAIIEQTLEKRGYDLIERSGIIYGCWAISCLARTAEQTFHAAGGPRNYRSAWAEAAATSEEGSAQHERRLRCSRESPTTTTSRRSGADTAHTRT